MPEYEKPKVKRDGILLQASGGKELVFTQVEVVSDTRLFTVKFIVGDNSLSVMVTKATARDLHRMLGLRFDDTTDDEQQRRAW